MKANLYRKLPKTPGVYLMKGIAGKILYIGKAGNLRRRVASYFQRPQEHRFERLLQDVRRIDIWKTDTAIEALILEAELIRKHQPSYNVREKDDKSFLYVEVTKERFPRVLLVRGKDVDPRSKNIHFGPFTSSTNLREAIRILRRIFPWSDHVPVDSKRFGVSRKIDMTLQTANSKLFTGQPCFNYQIGLCAGTCCGAVSVQEYQKNIARLTLFFSGKKQRITTSLKHEMKTASKNLEFEKAERIRRQIFALQHIQDTALITESDVRDEWSVARTPYRIEGYDISNISGDSAVGSMVVFENNKPNVGEYRKFKIRESGGPDDTAMLREVIVRRFRHPEWRYPDLVLVDGGVPQVNAVRRALREAGVRISVLGLAKGPERKRNDVVGVMPDHVSLRTLIRIRDEAHRFAIAYHRKTREKTFQEFS